MPAKPASFFYSFFINGCNVQPDTNQLQNWMCSLTQGKKRTVLISLRNPRLSQANASTQSNSSSFT
jgi:hypothetical protein